MALTDAQIRKAKPRPKPYRLFDGGGLYLEVAPSGGKLWRLKYRYAGKEKRLALGAYPEVGLREARNARDDARKLLAGGTDPGAVRKIEKAARRDAADNTLEALAREWLAAKSAGWAASHTGKILRRLEMYAFPVLGNRPVREVTAPEILAQLQKVAEQSPETARRLAQALGRVFRFAIRTHRANADPTAGLTEALPPVRSAGEVSHFAAIVEPQAVGALLRAIWGYQGTAAVGHALRLAPLVFVRPGELRGAEWAEIDLDVAEPVWRIPAAKMKARREHLVPLAVQAVAILREVRLLTGRGRYVFPSVRSPDRAMSENTVLAALRRLGYSGAEMTGHGFRSVASTLLHERGYPSHVIEAQLAHVERNAVKAAYNRAAYLPERRKLMQEWADYLDGLRNGATIIGFNRDSKKAIL